MRIAFIAGAYPSVHRPSDGAFVQQFVWAMARQENECTVIGPSSVFDRRHGRLPPAESLEEGRGSKAICVLRPRYVSFSSQSLGFTHTGRWTQGCFNATVGRAIRGLKRSPELIYGHFLYQAGFAALVAAKRRGCPVVIGVGEDHLWTVEAFGEKTARRHFADAGYFLANSTQNGRRLESALGIAPDRILVEPNGVDLSQMYPRDRAEMRRKHGFGPDEWLVAFVGANEVRKGPERVVEAVEGVAGVTCLLVGTGTDRVGSGRVVRSGVFAHETIPELLSCADVFVLPTTSEGSCNAVIEAMACGLPIVTARGDHMVDLVDDEVALRVDPMNVEDIRAAIRILRDDRVLREGMAAAALQKARGFDIDQRARRVTAWMMSLLERRR